MRVSTVIAVEPHEAFRIFTEEVDLWWKRSPRFRKSSAPNGTMRFDPGEGGRLIEIADDLEGGQHQFGRILVLISILVFQRVMPNAASDVPSVEAAEG